MGLPILGVENVLPILDVVGYADLHFFKFWDDGDVSNIFLVDKKSNGTKSYLLVGGFSTYVAISKQLTFPYPNLYEELFIVHLILCGSAV